MISTLPLRFFESHRVTIPAGGVFYDRLSGKPVVEDTVESVLQKMRQPTVLAKAKATSSGVLINGRVYPGVKMKASTHYFTDNHGKPVLTRHPTSKTDHPDRVGRIVSAEYVKLFTDKLWQDDYKAPKPNGHPGSGYILLDTQIGGTENVARVMDKRDLTLSVGFTPTAYYCSICGQDWVLLGEPCGHEPMKAYEVEDAKSRTGGLHLCFGITGMLIYDHVALVNFPGDPTAQFLSTRMQDSCGTMDYFTNRIVESYQGQLAGFILMDAANNRALELQLDPPPAADHGAPQRKDDALLCVAVDVDLTRDAKETTMDKPTTDASATAVADAKPTPTPQPTPAQDAATPPTPPTTDAQPAATQQDEACGAWTMPDPVDGHTHGLAKLGENGEGETSPSMGTYTPEHTHKIKYGRVLPWSGGEGEDAKVSRHPNSYFYDENGVVKGRFQDEAVEAAAAACEPCHYNFEAEGADGEFALTDELEDAVEKFETDELTDMLDEAEAARAGTLPCADAVLTASSRKKIPTRLFCGPNRTFPAHDKAHVRNALARLPQSKNFSASQKASILACLKRRAKALGVTVGSDQKEDPSTKGDASILMDGPDQAILKTLGQEIQAKGVKIGQLQSSLDEKTKELKSVTKQLQNSEQENIRLLVDQVITAKLALRKPDMIQVKTTEDMQKVRDELTQRSVDSLRDFARELQVELASGGPTGAQVSPATAPPDSGVGSLGAAPTPRVGEDGRTLADETLERIKRLSQG